MTGSFQNLAPWVKGYVIPIDCWDPPSRVVPIAIPASVRHVRHGIGRVDPCWTGFHHGLLSHLYEATMSTRRPFPAVALVPNELRGTRRTVERPTPEVVGYPGR